MRADNEEQKRIRFAPNKKKNRIEPQRGTIGILVVVMLAYAYFSYSSYYSEKATNTQDAIIGHFKSNEDAFREVADYTINDPELNQFDKQTKFNQINDAEFENQCMIILNNLSYDEIIENDNLIYFIKTRATAEKGIVYIKNNSSINESSFSTLEPITGQWYYYENKI